MITLQSFSEDIIRPRRMLRMSKVRSARIIEISVWYLSTVTTDESVPRLKKQIKSVYKQVYTFDPLTMLLLSVLINAIVRIIIEWWFARRERNRATAIYELQSLQKGCTSLQRLLLQKGIS